MDKMAALKELAAFYHGFYVNDPEGNNAFSFEQRQNRRIYVPALVQGDLQDVLLGDEVVFSEIANGLEKNVFGLKNFIYWRHHKGKEVFIFDNHQHAFAFWSFWVKTEMIAEGATLVHIDQHKDTRRPAEYLEKGFWKSNPLSVACSYANRVLNVGNFIDPALKSGMFHELIMVDHDRAFEQEIKTADVLDIDLDIFSPDMEYIAKRKKIEFIRGMIAKAPCVTIATSPYFMDQYKAIDILKELFNK